MNAKKEFLVEVKCYGKPICANICSRTNTCKLKPDYGNKEYDEFLKSLDFDYDAGYGGQELFGTILFNDSFSDRHEYDGSENWDNHRIPTAKQVMED